MTRQEMIIQGRDLLGEFFGTAGDADPFAWSRLVSTAADEIARATDCFYTTATADLVAGQAEYCAPQITKVKAVSVYDASGARRTIGSATIASMDGWSAHWRDEAAGTPATWVPMGLNQIVLYPAPSYAATGGLVVEGYGVPGVGWAAMSAACPLPDRAHMAVVYKAALLRIIQNPSPENLTRRAMLADEFAGLKGKLEAETRRFAAATRVE
ncbi:MAG: hypothetical protein ABIZ35_05900 [Capsulimonas sp.]|uniref:phage adaptor protein n=1 Tax=Capsulimonas sp. TaxID=2494211 RepID=UPI003265331F